MKPSDYPSMYLYNMERTYFPVSVHLFLMNGKNILLLKRFNTGYEDGNYSVIAGHLDGGENIYNAMIREAREEAGIEINKNDLKIIQVMHRKQPWGEYIDYFFVCKKWCGDIINNELDKCSELKWYSIKKLPENTIEYIKYAINNYLSKIKFSIFGW